MMDAALLHFGVAVGLLALGALLAGRLGLPALPAYLLIGVLAGSWLEVERLQPLPDLGLLLLLFSVGLEFGPDRLAPLSRRVLRAGLWDALALPIGWLAGLLLGLDWRAALLLAGIVYVSSSAVIARLIISLGRSAYPESEVVLSLAVLQDLLIMAVLTITAEQVGAPALLASLVLVSLYLLGGALGAPYLARPAERLSSEALLLLAAAFTVGTAALFQLVGASGGLGAFLAGTVAARLGQRERLDALIGPIRDLASALFFLTVGIGAQAALAGVSGLAIALAAGAILLKLPLNYLSGAAAGLGLRGRLLTALYMVPRGEFNLVLGAIALQTGAPLVAQVALLSVLISVPLGALAIQVGPRLTRRFTGRRQMPLSTPVPLPTLPPTVKTRERS